MRWHPKMFLRVRMGSTGSFIEGFFDYAFARRFVRRGRRLIHLLLNEGEQHLFRKAPVRQNLAFLRDHERSR